MTEGSYDDGNYLVRVRAQVMTRDDSTGGWLPMGGGGLSNVSVRKRLLSSSSSSNNSSSGIAPSSQHASLGVLANVSGKNNGSTRGSVGGGTSYNPGGSDEDLDSNLKHEYLIYGKRISDSSVVLSCPIRKDFQYNKVMPTFHHWKTGDKKFGLTFQTAADARAFDKGVRRAVEDLLEGIGELSCFHDETDIGDDDVFMTLELPVDSRSSSGSSSASGGGGSGVVVTAAALGRHPLNPLSMFPGSMMDPSVGGVPNQSASPYTHPHANHHHLHRMHFIRSSNTSGSNNNQGPGSLRNQFGGGTPASDQWTGSNNPAVLSGGMGESGILSDSINQQFSSGKDIWVPYNKSSKTLPEDRIEISGEPYSYVQFAKDKNSGPFGSRNASGEHEYSYPVMDALKLGGGVGLTGSGLPQQHSSSLKKKNQLHQGNTAPLTAAQQPPLLLPTKCKRKKDYFGRRGIQNLVTPGHRGLSGGAGGNGSSGGGGGRAQCRHCLEMYDKDNNGRGSCEYAPDGVLACINSATCISCAQCMLYHCMSDAEGDFDQHPCSCNGSDDRCQRRWASMALLSLFVPCLWCYLPFKACHTCAVKCGCCGGRHQQSFSG